ncbi:MAG: lipoyl domain-containing protein [Candidatus Omnitrophota bacterium]
MIAILVPDLGDGITKVEVASWHKREGEAVVKDDDLVELVTDKASFNIPAPVSGILRKIHYPAGGEAVVGSLLGEIA